MTNHRGRITDAAPRAAKTIISTPGMPSSNSSSNSSRTSGKVKPSGSHSNSPYFSIMELASLFQIEKAAIGHILDRLAAAGGVGFLTG